MSDLWERCRRALRERLTPDDWRHAIGRLRGWIDCDVFYLWVDRAADDWRAIPNPAKDFDREIRETVQLVFGRAPKGLRYLDRPPNREQIINVRRARERRAKKPAEQEKLFAYAKEECERLLENPPRLPPCRSDVERIVLLQRMAMDRAKRRIENEPLRPVWTTRSREDAPRDPPSWPPRAGK